METGPDIVSVICLCYNHGKYVVQAIQSVLKQSYRPIEIILIDDCSTDNSRIVIREFIRNFPDIIYIENEKNLGNCKSFNKGFQISKGKYLIDFAADDLMYPNKIAQQVSTFKKLEETYGVVHHDVRVLDENKAQIYQHSSYVKKLINKPIPDGLIFEDLLRNYIVSSPSMMIKREVLEELNGYDENLSYEDFDFWLRSSHRWKYHYIDNVLMEVIKLRTGMSSPHSGRQKIHAASTLIICRKMLKMNLSEKGKKNLRFRVFYEIKECLLNGNIKEAVQFIRLLFSLT